MTCSFMVEIDMAKKNVLKLKLMDMKLKGKDCRKQNQIRMKSVMETISSFNKEFITKLTSYLALKPAV